MCTIEVRVAILGHELSVGSNPSSSNVFGGLWALSNNNKGKSSSGQPSLIPIDMNPYFWNPIHQYNPSICSPMS